MARRKKVTKKKVAKKAVKKVEKKVEDITYKLINKEGDDLYLKPSVYSKIEATHTKKILIKKDVELAVMQKKMLEMEFKSVQEEYKKAIEDKNKLALDLNNKEKEQNEKYNKIIKDIYTELGGKAFSVVDEDTYKIKLE